MGELLNWFESLLTGFANVGSWLVTPLPVVEVSPLVLASGVGLLVFLGIAITKWILS